MRTMTAVYAIAAAVAASVPAAQAAGTVDVAFVNADSFSDIGRGSVEIERNTAEIAAHFRRLAARLPDGQHLRVEVLDVDLAGELRPTRNGRELRIVRGGADWPSMTLRYTLTSGGRSVASGEERVTDMNYAYGSGHRRYADEPLGHDRRMLDVWFDERISPRRTASR